jgi:hypothetical protein
MGGVGAGAMRGRAGVSQADLAAGGNGAVGLARLLGQQPAAFRGLEQPLVDLPVVESTGGDQVVEVAGGLPELLIALPVGAVATRASSWARAACPYPGPGRSPTGRERRHWLAGPAGGAAVPAVVLAPRPAACPGRDRRPTGRGGPSDAGWVGRPHSRRGRASSPPGAHRDGRCPGRSGPDRNATRRHRYGPVAQSSAGRAHWRSFGSPGRRRRRRCPGRRSGGHRPGRCWPGAVGSTRPAPEPDSWSRP